MLSGVSDFFKAAVVVLAVGTVIAFKPDLIDQVFPKIERNVLEELHKPKLT